MTFCLRERGTTTPSRWPSERKSSTPSSAASNATEQRPSTHLSLNWRYMFTHTLTQRNVVGHSLKPVENTRSLHIGTWMFVISVWCLGNPDREVWRRFQAHLRPQRPRRRAVVPQIRPHCILQIHTVTSISRLNVNGVLRWSNIQS